MLKFFKKIISFIMSTLAILNITATDVEVFVEEVKERKDKIIYSEYVSNSEKFCEIPGLDTKFVPQGLDYCEYLDKVIICGYMDKDKDDKTNAPSRIYVINPESRTTEKYVTLTNVDGSEYIGHCGGIASFEKNAWVVSNKYAYRLSLDKLKNAEDQTSIQFEDKFNSGTRASYISCSDGILWIGEYHRKWSQYKTDKKHRLTSPNGEKMYAWTCGYILKSGHTKGFDYDGTSKKIVAPDYILETESMCQGFTQLPDGRFVTSISGKIFKSELNIYENVLKSKEDKIIKVSGKNVKLWFLDSSKMISSLKALPNSEGIDYYHDELLVVYESASKKMKLRHINGTKYIWSVQV